MTEVTSFFDRPLSSANVAIICDLVIFSFTAFIFAGAFGAAFFAIELIPLCVVDDCGPTR